MEKIKTFRGSNVTEQVNKFLEENVKDFICIKYKPLIYQGKVVETALLVYVPKIKKSKDE